MGAEDEFDAFVVGVGPSLVRAAWLLVGDRGSAEDIVQDVLVQVLRHWARIAPEARRAYATKSVVRLARRSLLRARFRSEVLLDDVPEQASTDDDRALTTELRAGLMALPTRQREAVVLRYLADQSVEATADLMRCSPGTVKSQCSKGLASLRDWLATNTEPLTIAEDR